MDEHERDLYRRLGWFAPDSVILGMEMRPVSLASMEAMRLMGIAGLLESVPETETDFGQETREIAAYLWLHAVETPVPVVERAIWDGSWRAVMDSMELPSLDVVVEFRVMRERLRALIVAAGVTVKPKPKSKSDDTPWNVMGPGAMAFDVAVIARATGWGRREILWDTPLYQALQIYHAELRWNGLWTVPPGSGAVEPSVFENFELSALGED
jgi:hypothetical protein